MITRIGGNRAPEGLTDMLLHCHERIRNFTKLARRIAEAPDAPESEVRQAAGSVYGYFYEALPLHIRDEEESILPRLRGKDSAVDAALAEMEAQHTEHERPLARLLELTLDLREGRTRASAVAAELGAVAGELEREFGKHLEIEERVIFPALSTRLDAASQAAVVQDIRARRDDI